MLPGLDGWELIETVRGEGIGTPIVVVSARGTEGDRIRALELGADDYLVKPFSMGELVARVRAAVRRGVSAQSPDRGERIEIEELVIDPANVQAYVDGESAELTPTEFRLLHALALEQGRVVTREELMQRIWGRRQRYRDRTVDVFVRKLQGQDRPPCPGARVHPHTARSRLQARSRSQSKACPAREDRRDRPARAHADEGRERLLNRELSRIDWSTRVLEQAFDESLPLLERVKYCAFFSSHMDEFFAVRVAGLLDQAASGLNVRSDDGRYAEARCSRRSAGASRRSPRARRRSGADDLGPALAAEGIRIGTRRRLRRRGARSS